MAERSKPKAKPKAKAKGNGNGKAGKVVSLADARTSKRHGKKDHNGGPPLLGGDVTDEIYQRHLRTIQSKRGAFEKARDAAKQANGEYRSALKAAKADGVDTEAVLLAHTLEKRDSVDVARLYHNAGRVLRLRESPLHTQLNLFSDVALPAPENPVLAGEAAGKRGERADANPHTPGSEPFVQWEEARARGAQAAEDSFR